MRRENLTMLSDGEGSLVEAWRHVPAAALQFGNTFVAEEDDEDQGEDDDEQDEEAEEEDEEVEHDEEEQDEEAEEEDDEVEQDEEEQDEEAEEEDEEVEQDDDELDEQAEEGDEEVEQDAAGQDEEAEEEDEAAVQDAGQLDEEVEEEDAEVEQEEDEQDEGETEEGEVEQQEEGQDDEEAEQEEKSADDDSDEDMVGTELGVAAKEDDADEDDNANGTSTNQNEVGTAPEDDGGADDNLTGSTTTTAAATAPAPKDDDAEEDGGKDEGVQISSGISSLSYHKREETYYGRCPCDTGIENLEFWANAPKTPSGGPPQGRSFKVRAGEAPVFTFPFALTDLTIQCSGSDVVGRLNVIADAGQPISVLLDMADNNSDHHFCGKSSAGFVTVNSWQRVPLPAGPVFVSGTDGFSCFKSPQLLRLRSGAMLAFAQAFWPSCTEAAHTTIVFRRSQDEGASWSPLAQLVKIDEIARQRLGLCGEPLSMSHVVPIELDGDSFPGRVLVLYMRNHYRAWLVRSDDGGMTWGGDREVPAATPSMSAVQKPDCGRTIDWFAAAPGPFSYIKELGEWMIGMCWYTDNNPYMQSSVASRLKSEDWQWVGIGPGGAVQLRTGEKKGRILVPGYHSFIRKLDPTREPYNPTAHFWRNTAEIHTLVSDDGGETWEMAEGSIEESNTSRETNFFQLSDGEVYANSATLALGTPQFRTQAKVRVNTSEGTGVKLEELRFTDIPQPLGGCQGAVAVDDDDAVYVTGPNGPASKTVKALEKDIGRCTFNSTGRSGLTVWRSVDRGNGFGDTLDVDNQLSADSSIQVHSGRVWVLYEQADPFPAYEMYGQRRRLGDMQIFDPDRIMFTTLDFPPHTTTTTTAPPSTIPASTTSHALVFDASDGVMDLAYYLSKSDCETNENALGWYISEADAGGMLNAGTDCKCHAGLSTAPSGPDGFSISPCLHEQGGRMTFTISSGDECGGKLEETAEVNILRDDIRKLRQGECVVASVMTRGDGDVPTSKYFKVEVAQKRAVLNVEVKKQ